MKNRPKDETYWEVLKSALELDFRKGHLKWTISDLSRSSGVTRPLIYYYFGRSRDALLLEAVRFLGEELLGLTPMRLRLWSEGKIKESVLASRQAMEKFPYIQAFYFSHRGRETKLGEEIRLLERKYNSKLARFFSDASDAERGYIFSLILGLVFAPNISTEAIDCALDRSGIQSNSFAKKMLSSAGRSAT